MTDIPADSSTTAVVSIGSSVAGSLEVVGDRDWYRIDLSAGQEVSVSLTSASVDCYVRLVDAAGNVLFENDDGGGGTNSLMSFKAPSTGTFYIVAGSYSDGDAGAYQLSVSAYVTPPVWTVDQVATELTSTYWRGDVHHFNVTQGGTISVNLTALAADAQTLARAALAEWSDVIGVSFNEVTTGGQITFSNDQDGAFTTGTWSAGIIQSQQVNVSTQWMTDYANGTLNSYAFQTFIHEIGHALGLGHAGLYNDTATYPYDASFANDGWPLTVISYFDQNESSYFADQGFTRQFVGTPMMADIVAMQTLYGLSTTTRTGNTVYGYHSTAGRDVFDAAKFTTLSYTIVDSGGTDTLDYSGYSGTQLINLNAETYSNVLGHVGNVSIARGTVIENAIGGSGDDTIVANGANNVLTGGAGVDTLSYAGGSAGVTVDLRLTTAQNTVGSGTDTVSGFEKLVGSAGSDHLTGSSTTLEIHGGDGGDVISDHSTGTADIYGDGGDDIFIVGLGSNASYDGGAGFNTIDLGAATGGVTVYSSGAGQMIGGGFGTISISAIERINGSSFNDTLTAGGGNIQLYGNAGNDTLAGTISSPNSYLAGGAGNDTYVVYRSDAVVYEANGQGTDLVQAYIDFTLPNNVENLTLVANSVEGTGNSIANVLTGNGRDNHLYGMAGNDTLIGGGGNDTLDGGTGVDTMTGGTGNDTYIVDNVGDVVVEKSGEGTDTVMTSIAYVLGANVEDLVQTGIYSIIGKGNALDNELDGNSGSNRLYAYAGNDVLIGGAGNDFLDGGAGVDHMVGGAGNDTYYIDNAGDTIVEDASAGNDIVHSTISWTLADNFEQLRLDGTAAIDGTGNSVNNIVMGNGAANTLDGGDGNDRLFGLGGDDILIGGAGSDQLTGGPGHDVMTGGSGGDRFIFNDGDFGTTMATADEITDYDHSQVDRIRLREVDANTGTSAHDPFTFIGAAAFSGHAGELRYEQVGGNTYVEGDTNGDGVADLWIQVDGLHTMLASDFIL